MTVYRIKDVAMINKQVLPEETDPDFSFKYVDIGAVSSDGKITITNETTEFSSAPSRARRLAPGGSVVVSTVRTYLQAIATVPQNQDPLVFSTGFAVLEATSKIDERFLGYYCRSQGFLNEVTAKSTGVSFPAINPSEIGRLKITLPPLEEQRRITDFLDAETAYIDTIYDRRLRQVAALRERAYAEVSEILIPGILTRPLGDPPWPWLPEMTSEQPLARLGYVCRLQNGVTVDGKRDVTGDIITRPYLRVANVQTGRVDLSTVNEISVPRSVAARSTLRRGDVLMTEGGDLDKLGRGAVWNEEIPDCLHQNHVFALRPDPELLDGRYLSLLTQTVHGRCYFESTGSRTTNLASTNSNKILSFPIPLPSVQRQRDIANEAQKGLDRISKTILLLERQLKLLAERRQALITAAVTGQFDVSAASGRGVTE